MSTIGHNGSPEESERPGNWFAVSRDIFDHPIIGIHNRPFTDTEAWLWLLASASYETRRAMNKGTVIILDPGDLMAAHPYLGTRWMWHVSKVRRFLDRLSNEAMITRFCDRQTGSQRNNQIQVITICNYSRYQIIKEAQEAALRRVNRQPSDSQPTAKRQPTDSNITSITAEPLNTIPSALQAEGDRNINSPRSLESGADLSGDVLDAAWKIAGEISEKVKGPTKNANSRNRPKGELDGSHGITFTGGKLTVVNGTLASLQAEFPGIDFSSVCNKAAPALAKLSYPTFEHAMATLRQYAQYAVDDAAKRTGGKSKLRGRVVDQVLKSLSPEKQREYFARMKGGGNA